MKLAALILLFSTSCFGNALSLSFGPSLDDNRIGEKKAIMAGYEFQWSELSLNLESGAWNDPKGETFFGGANVGLHLVNPDGLSMRVGVGPTGLSQTGDRTSSIFEFHIQVRAGLDLDNFSTGFSFDHFSNAGLVPPNLGLDLLSLYIGFPL